MGFKQYWARQFRKPAGLGGKISTFLMNKMNKLMRRFIEKEIKPDTTVLDIGFGNGYALQRLLKNSNSTFYGIDISADMVKAASKRNQKAIKEGRLILAEASADKIPFNRKFGQIYTMNTVYFWNDLQSVLKEVYSKLEAGGEFYNVFRNKEALDKTNFTQYEFAKYTEQEILQATEQAGFCAELIKLKEGFFCVKAKKLSVTKV